MPTIRLIGFRGLGSISEKEGPYQEEHPLILAGHVALADVIEGKLIGFSPTPEAAEALGGVNALLDALIHHEAQPGRLQDDTVVFKRAKELSDAGENITVIEAPVAVSEEMLAEIKLWYNEARIARYCFPDKLTGKFREGESNCAIFPERFGIELPSANGNLRVFMLAMKQLEGAKSWSGQ